MQYRYLSQSFIYTAPSFFFLFLSVLQQYSMLIRDKSKSKLSNASSKSKIKQTIRIALGKSNTIIEGHPFQNKVLRSQSAKSLKSYQKSSMQASSVGVREKINRSNSQRYLEKKKELAKQSILESNWKKNENSVKTEQKIINFSWWHYRGFKIESQKKIVEKKGCSIFLQYFAYTQNTNKTVVAAIENNFAHIGVPNAKLICTTLQEGRIIVIEDQKRLDLGKIRDLIIIKQLCCEQLGNHQGLDKLIEQVEDKIKLKSIITNPIEFYMIIGEKDQGKSRAEEIMEKIVKKQNSDSSNKKIGDYMEWKLKMGSKIRISQEALLRYKT